MRVMRNWFDSHYQTDRAGRSIDRIEWFRIVPFISLHLACFAVIWVGISAVAVWTAVGLYVIRMFAITAFYHRYFSHKTFKTSRLVQFIFAVIGTSATQRGPLWWAAQHRQHHRYADKTQDPHSPKYGFLRSHMGWFLTQRHFVINPKWVADWQRYPELRWLDRFDVVPPILLAVSLYFIGEYLGQQIPALETNGWQMVIWGYFISTVVLLHMTLLINSLAHYWGSRRYETQDDSRNNFLLALLTLGEGWHNNHHYHAGSTRQGFYWWEVDISFYGLWLMSKLGLVWDLRHISVEKRDRHLSQRGAEL